MKITQKQREELWGEGGPYSQVKLVTEARILDDRVSRTFLIVEADINPFTYRLIKKHHARFKDDPMVGELLDRAEYRGSQFGYVACTFSDEYHNESVMKEAQCVLECTQEAIIKMHRFVIDLLGKK